MLLQAGRYAAYVDAAYGISAVVLAGLVLASVLSAGRWRGRAERRKAATGAKARP